MVQYNKLGAVMIPERATYRDVWCAAYDQALDHKYDPDAAGKHAFECAQAWLELRNDHEG